MLVIVGLGNPGTRYENNRHNIGFMAVDAIHRRNAGFSPWRKRFRAETSEGRLGEEKVLLIKPQTYMNESGRAVGEAVRFYKLSSEDVTVLYDELDLTPGKVRIKTGGGAGGHNGIRSLDAHLGKDYRRVRLGIGHPGSKERVTGHVLGDFSRLDAEWLDPLLDALADNAGMLASGKEGAFMNRIHRAVTPEKPAGAGIGTGDTATPPARPPMSKSPAGRSHIRQARPKPKPDVPKEGPLAAMLRGLLGPKRDD